MAAELIALLLQGDLLGAAPTRNLAISGAHITGDLWLGDITLACPLELQRCRFEGTIVLREADVARVDLSYSCAQALDVGGAHVKGALRLTGFTVNQITLSGATVDGDLDLSGASVRGRLIGDGAHVVDGIFLTEDEDRRFEADDAVQFVNAKTTTFVCTGADLRGQPRALTLDNAAVATQFALDCGNHRFHAAGYVKAIALKAGDVDCDGAQFDSGLILEQIELSGNLYLTKAQVPELWLTRARIAQLVDDPSSWPPPSRLHVVGFTYLGFGDTLEPEAAGTVPLTPTHVGSRLIWLSLQPDFSAQPYEQLAAVYARLGDEQSARKVGIRKEWMRLRRGHPGLLYGAWSLILGATLGFGYSPRRAIGILLAIWIAGALALALFSSAQAAIVQSKPPSGKAPVSAAATCPKDYPCFSRWAYSWDTVVPLVRLGQIDYWRPAGTTAGRRVRAVGNVMTVLGWLFATLAAAGLTGMVRKT